MKHTWSGNLLILWNLVTPDSNHNRYVCARIACVLNCKSMCISTYLDHRVPLIREYKYSIQFIIYSPISLITNLPQWALQFGISLCFFPYASINSGDIVFLAHTSTWTQGWTDSNLLVKCHRDFTKTCFGHNSQFHALYNMRTNYKLTSEGVTICTYDIPAHTRGCKLQLWSA